MDVAKALIETGKIEEAVIVAKSQTKGRGRRGRIWESLQGNLFLTYIFINDCSLSIAPQLSIVACVAVGETLQAILPPGNTITYKWPNDLLLNNKKLSGILLETVELIESHDTAYLIGCGLNIVEFPKNVRYPTTSLQEENIHLSYDELMKGIISSLQKNLKTWADKGFETMYGKWVQNAAYIDSSVTLDLHGEVQTGIFKGIDKDGAMLLKTSNGLITVNAGEVLTGGTHAFSN